VNTVTIAGNMVDNAAPKGGDDTMLCTFTIAVDKRQRRGDEWETVAHFLDVVVFGDQMPNILKSVHRGDRVIVHGRMQHRTWENAEGERRSKVEIVADEVAPSLRWATTEVTRIPFDR
jgi:single-strand DNA-binding protein